MTREEILVVDDEPGICKLVGSTLTEAGYRVTAAPDVAEARQALQGGPFAIVLLDVELPGDSGIDLLRDLAPMAPDLAVVMVSAHDDPSSTRSAVELGAYGYVVKPFRRTELLVTVECALRRRRHELQRRDERHELVGTARRSTRDLRDALVRVQHLESELGLSHEEVVRRIAQCVDVRDGGTGAHLRRVSLACGRLGRQLGLDRERVRLLRQAATLHDIGKIAVPDAILLKPGPLDAEERALIEGHTSAGFEILRGSGSPMLDLGATIALTHHERFDGTGYPLGLAGETIPLESRIVAVVDAFDAMTHDRPYRRALSIEETLDEIAGLSGTAFDPAVVEALIDYVADTDRAELLAADVPTAGKGLLALEILTGGTDDPDAANSVQSNANGPSLVA